MVRYRIDGAATAQADGQAAPLSIQASISWPKVSWVPGTGVRPAPGAQPQPTS